MVRRIIDINDYDFLKVAATALSPLRCTLLGFMAAFRHYYKRQQGAARIKTTDAFNTVLKLYDMQEVGVANAKTLRILSNHLLLNSFTGLRHIVYNRKTPSKCLPCTVQNRIVEDTVMAWCEAAVLYGTVSEAVAVRDCLYIVFDYKTDVIEYVANILLNGHSTISGGGQTDTPKQSKGGI